MIALYMVVFCIGNSADNIRQKCLVLCSPPKCRAFIVILCIMLHNTKQKFSTKTLMAAKQAVGNLKDMIEEMNGALSVLTLIHENEESPFDTRTLDECSRLMETFHRLVMEQEAMLKHTQLMQISDTRANILYGRMQRSYAASKSKSVLKN